MTDNAEAVELCETIKLNLARLGQLAEQLSHHASGAQCTDVVAHRTDSMEVMRDLTRALVALIELAATVPAGKMH